MSRTKASGVVFTSFRPDVLKLVEELGHLVFGVKIVGAFVLHPVSEVAVPLLTKHREIEAGVLSENARTLPK